MRDIPKDRQVVIKTESGKFVAIWSAADEAYAYADLNVVHAHKNKLGMQYYAMDTKYYQTSYIDADDIICWKELW